MKRRTVHWPISTLCALLCLHVTVSAAESISSADPFLSGDTSAEKIGERIYREGVLPDGKIVTAIAQQDIALSGARVICADCHRRSAMGSSEGGNAVPAVSGSILFNPREKDYKQWYGKRSSGPGARPAYTDETLRKAIREGVDPTGRALDKLMPRFDISDRDLGYLIAYLNSIDSSASPGVTDSAIHFATVVTPGADAGRKDTMLAALTAYVSDMNAGTRGESKRSEFAPWPKSWHYKSYRQWRLHVWELTGDSAGWQEQLNEHYKQQPVFAVINGIGPGDWRPIHDFCNKTSMPCIFPSTNLPVTTTEDFYTVYFSRGIVQEAETVAKQLSQLPTTQTVLQIYTDQLEATAAEAAAAEDFIKYGITQAQSLKLGSSEKMYREQLRAILQTQPPGALILWLDSNDIARLAPILSEFKNNRTIFLSASMLSGRINSLPPDLLENAFLLSQYVPPDTLPASIARAKTWANARKVPATDDEVLANAYFAMTTTADIVKHLRGNLMRDLFLERLEHFIDSAVFHSVYPRLSLGPGQRFASKGCYIVGPLGKGKESMLTASREWVVP